jgi:hypothetical protein
MGLTLMAAAGGAQPGRSENTFMQNFRGHETLRGVEHEVIAFLVRLKRLGWLTHGFDKQNRMYEVDVSERCPRLWK